MCARNELQYIIGHYDVWRNIYQHEFWHSIHHDDVHDYDDVYVYYDACSGACACDDVYVFDDGDIYVHNGFSYDGVNNYGRRNDDNKLFVYV